MGGWSFNSKRVASRLQQRTLVIHTYSLVRHFGPVQVQYAEYPVISSAILDRKQELLGQALEHLERLELSEAKHNYDALLNEPFAIGESDEEVYRDYCLGPAQVAISSGDYNLARQHLFTDYKARAPLPPFEVYDHSVYPNGWDLAGAIEYGLRDPIEFAPPANVYRPGEFGMGKKKTSFTCLEKER